MATGKEIKRLRGRMSAQEAATRIGVDVERLRKWEQRDADPKDSDDIRQVEKFFGVPLSGLNKLDNFPNVSNSPQLNEPAPQYDNITTLINSNRDLTDTNKKLAETLTKNYDELMQLAKMAFNFAVGKQDLQGFADPGLNTGGDNFVKSPLGKSGKTGRQ